MVLSRQKKCCNESYLNFKNEGKGVTFLEKLSHQHYVLIKFSISEELRNKFKYQGIVIDIKKTPHIKNEIYLSSYTGIPKLGFVIHYS